jgi:hypothetical protein
VSKSRKKTRRFLRRLVDRKGISQKDAIESFYGKKISDIERNLVKELTRERPCERIL